MSLTEQILTIAVVAIGTMFTRFVPFLLFPSGRKTPPFIKYLGKVLPGAVFGLLVIYCLKGIDLSSGYHGIPEMTAVLITALVHIWKKQMLFSIAAGTISYMLLVQFIFI